MEDNALLSVPQRGCCCGRRCCSRGSRWVGEESWRNLCNQCLCPSSQRSSQLPLSQHLDVYFVENIQRQGSWGHSKLNLQIGQLDAAFCRLLGPAWLRWAWRAPHVTAVTSLIGCKTKIVAGIFDMLNFMIMSLQQLASLFYFILLQRVRTTAIKYFIQVILLYFSCFILLVRRA